MIRHRLLDKLVLLPSRDPLDPGGQEPFYLETAVGKLEVFRQRVGEGQPSPRRVIIKWPGNAGRAENSTAHPALAWPAEAAEVWTVNPHGYGSSDGQASLRHVPAMARTVWQAAETQFPNTPKLIFGTSIGCVTTLHQTTLAQESSTLEGIILRNPPPLTQLINGHYHRWFYGPLTRWLTAGFSDAIDSVLAAEKCRVPLLLLQSECDTTVPPRYQNLIYDRYSGPKEKFIVHQAEHNELPEDPQMTSYLKAIREFTRPTNT